MTLKCRWSYCNTGVCLYSTQNSLFGIPQGLQLLLDILYHHGERSFSMGLQVCCSQLWNCGTQTFRVLFSQDRGNAQDATGLREGSEHAD